MPYLNHNIPTITCFIRNEYLFNHERGFNEYTLCDIHTVASIERRTLLFETFLENGVNWTRRPLSAFCWKPCHPEPLQNHMYWDCFSSYIDVQVRSRLSGLKAELIRWDNSRVEGTYLFTVDWSFENKAMTDTGFSETPEHKCAHVFKMIHGNYYAYPNNRIIWYDTAWTKNRIKNNPGYKIDDRVYSVENRTRFETDSSFYYKVTDLNDKN